MQRTTFLWLGFLAAVIGCDRDKGNANSSGGSRTLGNGEAFDVLNLHGSDTALFSGFTVDSTTVLIKFTYTGDSDLDGDIDADDYAHIDAGYSHAVALCMTVAAMHTGRKVLFDDGKQDIVMG